MLEFDHLEKIRGCLAGLKSGGWGRNQAGSRQCKKRWIIARGAGNCQKNLATSGFVFLSREDVLPKKMGEKMKNEKNGYGNQEYDGSNI